MISRMSQTTDKRTRTLPSATPTEAELAAWDALSRDEQVRRYQEMFGHPDCNAFTADTPDDILAAARQRVAARRNG
jgi:2-oxo-4-hydroxy-4-carboxy--5-ureidoimidazoline (OHCU) decarboxylase